MGDKMLNGVKSEYVNSLACVRVKGSQSEAFRIDSGMRRECIVYPWLFNVYMDPVMKEVKMGMGESGDCLVPCKQMAWFVWRVRGRPKSNGGTFS